MVVFSVLLKNGRTIQVEGADAYQPEGPMTTFFSSGSSRCTIDSWSTRIASYRTADVVAVQRRVDLTAGSADLTGRPELVAV